MSSPGSTPDPNTPPQGAGGEHVVMSETRARQGRPVLGMPVVLAVSTIAAVVLVFAAWFIFLAPARSTGGEDGASAAAARTFNEPLSQPKDTAPPNAAAPRRAAQ